MLIVIVWYYCSADNNCKENACEKNVEPAFHVQFILKYGIMTRIYCKNYLFISDYKDEINCMKHNGNIAMNITFSVKHITYRQAN